MFPREKVTDDWDTWEHRRLAWALEAHLISPQKLDQHSPPDKMRAMLEENNACEQPMPMGLGYHEKTGYFVLVSAGQGPCICEIEKGEAS